MMTVMKCLSLADTLTKVEIVDNESKLLARGNWYQDNILDHARDAVEVVSFCTENNLMNIMLEKVVE